MSKLLPLVLTSVRTLVVLVPVCVMIVGMRLVSSPLVVLGAPVTRLLSMQVV